jgi:hypothetical protein
VLPDECRLYRAGGKEIGRTRPTAPASSDVIDQLMLLLDTYPQGRRASLDLIVSDSVARVISLPWQDSLSGEEQLGAYARACFDQAGFDLDGNWQVQAAYRHFRDVGLGYALPGSLIASVHPRLLERQIQLRSIMPVSAHAYWRHMNRKRGKRTVLLLHERSRLSALLFDGLQCVGMQVQPTGSALPDAARRLFHSVEAVLPSVSHVQCWSSEGSEMNGQLIKSQFPVSSFDILPRLKWS